VVSGSVRHRAFRSSQRGGQSSGGVFVSAVQASVSVIASNQEAKNDVGRMVPGGTGTSAAAIRISECPLPPTAAREGRSELGKGMITGL
jgi:hypothetical protein